jgi:uncharacterized BrkB/YihY/UPF0761 family membrane protein
VKRALAPVRRYGLAVWARDRAPLRGGAALWTRIARIVTLSVRGVRKHKLSLQSAALAYYTLFSIVPVLVVALWVLKVFHLLHYLMPDVPPPPAATAAATASGVHVPEANVMLRSVLRAILSAVDRAGRLETGIVGLVALGYGVIRQLVHVEAALNTIAGRRDRPARRWRLLGYLALLALPPALLIVSGLLRSLSRIRAGAAVEGAVSSLFAAVPLLKSTLSGAVGVGILCLALTIFYGSAMRARVARASTVFGAVFGALLLAGRGRGRARARRHHGPRCAPLAAGPVRRAGGRRGDHGGGDPARAGAGARGGRPSRRRHHRQRAGAPDPLGARERPRGRGPVAGGGPAAPGRR